MDDLTWRVRATVTKVIDGDTFAAELDLGWGVIKRETKGAPSRIRIIGYNSPERNEPGYDVATKALAGILPVGIKVWITSHALDSFGRVLATVHLMDGSDLLDVLPQRYRMKLRT